MLLEELVSTELNIQGITLKWTPSFWDDEKKR